MKRNDRRRLENMTKRVKKQEASYERKIERFERTNRKEKRIKTTLNDYGK